jgi:anti-sigma B factor antagonist
VLTDGQSQSFQINLATEETGAGRLIVVTPAGDLDLATAPALRETLIQLVTAGMVHVAVDLAGVAFIDSSGLGILATAAKRLEAANGRLAIRNPRPQAQQILELTGLDRVLAVEDAATS